MFYLINKKTGQYVSNDGTYTTIGVKNGSGRRFEDNRPAQTYEEYIRAGFVDMTDTYASKKSVFSSHIAEEDPHVQALLEDLLCQCGEGHYKVISERVSEEILEEAEEYLVCIEQKISNVNCLMEEIRNILPGADAIPDKDFVAGCRHLIQSYRQNGEEILHLPARTSLLAPYGIEIQKVDVPDFVKGSGVKAAYAVKNKGREDAFSKFLANKDLQKHPTKLLFHGTASQNVWPIIRDGLVISEYHANGHSYGHGLYFGRNLGTSRAYSSKYVFVFEVYEGNCYTLEGRRQTSVVNSDNIRDLLGMEIDSVDNGPNAVTIFNGDACAIRYLLEVK